MIKSVQMLHSFTFVFVVLFIASPHLLFAQVSGPTVYVWEFANRDGSVDETTESITSEFEEALIQAQCCTILQRRNYARLFEQRQNEKAIMKLDNVPEATVNGLKTLEANAIAFGEVYKDIQGGQVVISINFETFESTILAKASVLMPPFDYVNPFKRREKMAELLGALHFVDKTKIASSGNGAEEKRNTPANKSELDVPTTNFQAFVEQENIKYELVESGHKGGEYQVWFLATNEGADGSICLRYSTYLIDPEGNQHQQHARLASDNRGYFDCFWVQAPHRVPTRFGIAFDSISPSMKSIPLIEIVLHERSSLQFRDVPIPYKK